MTGGTEFQEGAEAPQEVREVSEIKEQLDRAAFEPEAAAERFSDIKQAEDVQEAFVDAVPLVQVDAASREADEAGLVAQNQAAEGEISQDEMESGQQEDQANQEHIQDFIDDLADMAAIQQDMMEATLHPNGPGADTQTDGESPDESSSGGETSSDEGSSSSSSSAPAEGTGGSDSSPLGSTGSENLQDNGLGDLSSEHQQTASDSIAGQTETVKGAVESLTSANAALEQVQDTLDKLQSESPAQEGEAATKSEADSVIAIDSSHMPGPEFEEFDNLGDAYLLSQLADAVVNDPDMISELIDSTDTLTGKAEITEFVQDTTGNVINFTGVAAGGESNAGTDQTDAASEKTSSGKTFDDVEASGLNKAADSVMSVGQIAAPGVPGSSVLSAAISGEGQPNDEGLADMEGGEGENGLGTEGSSDFIEDESDQSRGLENELVIAGSITVGGVEAAALDIPETGESTQIDEFSDPDDLMEGRERPDDTPEEATSRAAVEEAQDKAAKAERVNDALARAEAKYIIARGEAINAMEAYKDAIAEYKNKLVEFFNSLSPKALAQFDLTYNELWNSIDGLWDSIDVSEESEECQALYQELADAHELQADTLAEANKAADAFNDAKAEVEDLQDQAAKAEAEAAAAAKDAVAKVTGKTPDDPRL